VIRREVEPATGVVPVIAEPVSPGSIRASARASEQPVDPSLASALEELLFARRAPALVFQPIVDLQHAAIAGYEVLSRFPGPPSATPDRWFQAAYKMGRGAELEALVIEAVLSTRTQLPSNCFLSLNVAPEALLDARVRQLLQGQTLARLVLELTEHAAVADYTLLAHVVGEARALGAFVAVDDAGAGYASLQHILALRPDFVKLDRALIAGLHLDEAKSALIDMFGGFTSRIDAWLLAEGIEEVAELSRLSQLGVPLGQGYLLGRPVPSMSQLSEDMTRTLRRHRSVSQLEGQSVLALAEPHDALHAASRDEELVRRLLQDRRLTCLPLLDDDARPVALAFHTAAGGLARRAVTCVHESVSVREALDRALTRESASRFDPLLCCNELGHFRGVLRIERLIEAALPQRR
jgi:EAL domain-containing protein (putative c-di-GMP-specific phosphodiesterase class I)